MKTLKSTKKFNVVEGEEVISLTEHEFIAYVSKNVEVPEVPQSTEQDVISGMMTQAKSKSELGDEIEAEIPGITAVYDFILEAMEQSVKITEDRKAAKASEKAEKAAEKEAKKKAEEAAAKELGKKQNKFSEWIGKSSSKVDDNIIKEVTALSKSLPKEILLAENSAGNGFGFEIAEGAELTEAVLGKTIGALVAQQGASDFMTQSRGFLLGGMANKVKERGLYKSLIQAGKAISEALPANLAINGKAIESYARMESRIGLEYRNSEIKDSAYLKLANSKMPKKGDDESADEFEARTKEYVEDRDAIAEGLANGQILNAKEVAAKVIDMEVKHGIREEKDPNAKTSGDYFKQFFFATFYKAQLLGVHEEGGVVVTKGDDEEYTYTEADLDNLISEAKTNLANIINVKVGGQKCGIAEISAGSIEIDTVINVEDEESGKLVPQLDDKGEAVTESVTHKVYPVNPFK